MWISPEISQNRSLWNKQKEAVRYDRLFLVASPGGPGFESGQVGCAGIAVGFAIASANRPVVQRAGSVSDPFRIEAVCPWHFFLTAE